LRRANLREADLREADFSREAVKLIYEVLKTHKEEKEKKK